MFFDHFFTSTVPGLTEARVHVSDLPDVISGGLLPSTEVSRPVRPVETKWWVGRGEDG